MASRATRLHINLRQQLPIKCDSRKVGLPTKDAALNLAERLMDQGKVDPGCHITPYLCDRCGEWHVTNRRIVFV